MPNTDAESFRPFDDFHHVPRPEGSDPGGDLHAGADPGALVGLELDRLGVGHPLGVRGEVGRLAPDVFARGGDVDGNGDARHGQDGRAGPW